MKVQKTELECEDFLHTLNSREKTHLMLTGMKISFNQKIIRTWIEGMSKIEKDSFRKVLDEDLEFQRKENKGIEEDAVEVLNYINIKARIGMSQFQAYQKKKPTGSLKTIMNALHNGYTTYQLKVIVDKKLIDSWFIKNPKYYNPITMFRSSKLDRNLNG